MRVGDSQLTSYVYISSSYQRRICFDLDRQRDVIVAAITESIKRSRFEWALCFFRASLLLQAGDVAPQVLPLWLKHGKGGLEEEEEEEEVWGGAARVFVVHVPALATTGDR